MVITKDLGAVSAYAYAVEQGYQGTEEEFAELMARQATVAEEAAASADAAAESASEAQASAEQAEQSAQSISGDVERAEQAATTATGKATEAATSATTANGAAQTATGKASEASASATAAANSATAAASSATNAASSATAAQTAQTAAETAQGKAEDAQAAAEAAAQSVSESAAQIAKNTDNFASAFSASTTYAIGDYCIHEGMLYRFTSAHTGAWTGTDVISANVGTNLSEYDKSIDSFNVSINGIEMFDVSDFEVGSIAISTGGWTYFNSTTRIRVKQGKTFTVVPGDKITIGAGIRIYLGWKRENGTYGTAGRWLTSETVTTAEFGECVFTASYFPESTVTSVWSILENIQIVRVNNFNNRESNSGFTKGINHKGFCFIAPENTMPAYALSKEYGFKYVETDVSFTSDGVPVLLHDTTINRTARNADGTEISGTVNIADITYEQAQTYDFGIWKGSAYAGTKIPTFDEFISFCKAEKLHPYCEIKDGSSQENVDAVISILRKYGMVSNSTIIAFASSTLNKVVATDKRIRIGWLVNSLTDAIITAFNEYVELGANIFLDVERTQLTTANVEKLISNGIPTEVYLVDTTNVLKTIPSIVEGVTTNVLNIPVLTNMISKNLI